MSEMGQDQAWLRKAIGIAVAVAACAVAIRIWSGYPANPKGETSLSVALMIVVCAALVRFLAYLHQLWQSGNDRPIAAFRNAFPSAAREFAPIAIGVAVLAVFLFSISYLKSMIAAVVPFWADAPLAASDRLLFVDPEGLRLRFTLSCRCWDSSTAFGMPRISVALCGCFTGGRATRPDTF